MHRSVSWSSHGVSIEHRAGVEGDLGELVDEVGAAHVRDHGPPPPTPMVPTVEHNVLSTLVRRRSAGGRWRRWCGAATARATRCSTRARPATCCTSSSGGGSPSACRPALGDVVTLTMLGPGESFGEQALLDHARRSRTASAVALEPVEARTLQRQHFDELRRLQPSVDRMLVEILAAQVRRLSTHLVEALYLPVERADGAAPRRARRAVRRRPGRSRSPCARTTWRRWSARPGRRPTASSASSRTRASSRSAAGTVQVLDAAALVARRADLRSTACGWSDEARRRLRHRWRSGLSRGVHRP